MPAFASEMHVERGGARGRTLAYCLQAAAELGRFFERPEERQQDGSPASRKMARTKVCRRSSKTEEGNRRNEKSRSDNLEP